MPSDYLILCRPLLLLPSIFPNIRVFSNESALLSGVTLINYLPSLHLGCFLCFFFFFFTINGITVSTSLDVCMHAQSLSRVQLFATPWIAAYQAPLSVGFSR